MAWPSHYLPPATGDSMALLREDPQGACSVTAMPILLPETDGSSSGPTFQTPPWEPCVLLQTVLLGLADQSCVHCFLHWRIIRSKAFILVCGSFMIVVGRDTWG